MTSGAQPSRGFDEIFSIAYEELRRLAANVKRGDQSATLNTTALVNEAWLRLRNTPEVAGDSPLHFKRIAARAMRQILVEAARRRHAQKRGGEAFAIIVPLENATEAAPHGPAAAEEVLAIDEALTELEQLDARQAQLVQARFFGGLDVSELMQLLQVSEATVMRDWRMARAWLAHRIGGRAESARP
jgi:RNA polymerase sigma factor (TIGR02999 family)